MLAPAVPRQAPPAPSPWIRTSQIALVLSVALSIPAGVIAAFVFGADRNLTGDTVAIVFLLAFSLLLSTPWWPWAGARSVESRLESTCLIWFGLTFTTHLTWELFWLLLREQIIASPDQPWAFIWWMYIDGGDRRYASDGSLILSVELLSVLNGVLGFAALWLRRRSAGRSPVATFMLMATGVVHIYSALLYVLTESFGGYPNVDTTSFVDLWIKFGCLNGLWLVMPLAVFWWGMRTLERQCASGVPGGEPKLAA